MNQIVNGFTQGFGAADAYFDKKEDRERRQSLSQLQQGRHESQQQRQQMLDDRNDQRHQDTLSRQQSLDKQSQQRLDMQQQQGGWQQSYNNNQAQWAKDQKMLGPAWSYYREHGQVSPEHEEVFKNNKGYDPRTFLNPETRQQIKSLGEKMSQAVSTGKLSMANDPETVQLFGQVFKDKFAKSVGQVDKATGATITDSSFAGFIPANKKQGSPEDTITLAVRVTYDNGQSEIKPMTMGRSPDPGDPVLEMTPQELVGTVRAKMAMADMIEQPEYWDEMGESVARSLEGRSKSKTRLSESERAKTAHKRALADLAKDKRRALLKLVQEGYPDPTKKKDIEAHFIQAKDEIDKTYGATADAPRKPQYTSTIVGKSDYDVIKTIAEANKDMTLEQAKAKALELGYLK